MTAAEDAAAAAWRPVAIGTWIVGSTTAAVVHPMMLPAHVAVGLIVASALTGGLVTAAVAGRLQRRRALRQAQSAVWTEEDLDWLTGIGVEPRRCAGRWR